MSWDSKGCVQRHEQLPLRQDRPKGSSLGSLNRTSRACENARAARSTSSSYIQSHKKNQGGSGPGMGTETLIHKMTQNGGMFISRISHLFYEGKWSRLEQAKQLHTFSLKRGLKSKLDHKPTYNHPELHPRMQKESAGWFRNHCWQWFRSWGERRWRRSAFWQHTFSRYPVPTMLQALDQAHRASRFTV